MPRSLLEHGTALGDSVRHDTARVGMRQVDRKGAIAPGKCGFRGCNDDRMGGVWKDGGSYMCAVHRMVLMPLRIRKGEGLDQKTKQQIAEASGAASED
jgi:hypothetical protein